jgi:thiazole synthase
MHDELRLGNYTFKSRLLVGTGKFSSIDIMLKAVLASGANLVTVALRRFNPERKSDDLYAPLSALEHIMVMPNTSGARNAKEAVQVAVVGRELTGSPLVKLEIHPNPFHLMPDPIETFEAAATLVKEGFTVLPYMSADPVLAKRLEDVGCAAVMPLGSAIGSGHGLRTYEMLSLIIRESNIPVIVDAGLRSPSEAAAAMEMGCDAVLVNSAIALADNPIAMAGAFAMAVKAGRSARLAGIMSTSDVAIATSPLTTFLSREK